MGKPEQDKITDAIVRKLEPPAKGNRITYDRVVKGFGVRVTVAGARSFVLTYRRKADALERRTTIGAWPDWSVAAARDEAKRLKREIDAGGDPVGEHREQLQAPTVNDLCDRYEAEELAERRPSTQVDYRSKLRVHIRPSLGKRKVASIEPADVKNLLRAITARSGPYAANRVVALFSKLMTLAVQWGWRAANPCGHVQRNEEAPRIRYLKAPELERLFKALAEHHDQDAADFFKFLLLTGGRRGETRSARWLDFDLDSGQWTKPGATTKRKTVHIVPLNDMARELLAKRVREREDSEFVFPGRNGHGHRVDVRTSWRKICKAAKLENLRLHDLRHSYASILANSGVGLHTIGGLLGHTRAQTTLRYSHLTDDRLREATAHVGALISKVAS